MPEHQIPMSLSKANQGYETFVEEITELDEKDYILKKNCKFCTSKNRSAGEKEWERIQSFSGVARFFQKDNENISYSNVRAHIRNHYLRQEQRLRVREYLNELKPYLNQKTTLISRFNILLASFESKFHDIASQNYADPNLSMKQADVLSKLNKSMMDILEFQSRMHGEIKLAQVLAQKFQMIVAEAIKQQTNPQVKKVLVQVIKGWQTTQLQLTDVST